MRKNKIKLGYHARGMRSLKREQNDTSTMCNETENGQFQGQLKAKQKQPLRN